MKDHYMQGDIISLNNSKSFAGNNNYNWWFTSYSKEFPQIGSFVSYGIVKSPPIIRNKNPVINSPLLKLLSQRHL